MPIAVAADYRIPKQVEAMVAKRSRSMGGSTAPSTNAASKQDGRHIEYPD